MKHVHSEPVLGRNEQTGRHTDDGMNFGELARRQAFRFHHRQLGSSVLLDGGSVNLVDSEWEASKRWSWLRVAQTKSDGWMEV